MKLFNLKMNGWVAAILVIIVVFAVYYLGLYNQIHDLYNKNLFDKSTHPCPQGISSCYIDVTTPKYLAAFDDAPIHIVVTNENDTQSLTGTLIVDAMYGNPKPDDDCGSINTGSPLLLTDVKQSQYRNRISLDVDVPAGAVRIYVLYARLVEVEKDSKSVKFSYEWVAPDSTNTDLNEWNGTDKLAICSEHSSPGVFRELSIRYLLLPPFSTTFLPVISFFMVWLISGMMPQQNKSQGDGDKLTPQFLGIGLLAIVYLAMGYGIVYFALIANQKNSIWWFVLGFVCLVILFGCGNRIITISSNIINECVKWLKDKNPPPEDKCSPPEDKHMPIP